VFFDPTNSGTVFVADSWNDAIRTIAVATGTVTTLAGTGSPGFANGVGLDASFYYPMGVAFDAFAGAVIVADTLNHAIRTIAFDTGTVSTLAGGSQGFGDATGTLASFYNPSGVDVDPELGTVFVSDTYNNAIRTVDVDAAVTTWAGSPQYPPGFRDDTGTYARFNLPLGVVFSPDAVYVADSGNNYIRSIISDDSYCTESGCEKIPGGCHCGAFPDWALWLMGFGMVCCFCGLGKLCRANQGQWDSD